MKPLKKTKKVKKEFTSIMVTPSTKNKLISMQIQLELDSQDDVINILMERK